MQHTVVEVAPNIAQGLLGILKLLMARRFASMFITSAAIAGLTFGLLELFMRPGLKFQYGTKKLPKREAGRFMTSIILLIITFLPIITIFVQAFSPRHGSANIGGMMSGMVTACAISIVGCWIMSFILKRFLKPEEREHRHFLVSEALNVIGSTIGEHISDWISRIVMSIINMSIRIVHRPFVLEYGIVAVVLNLIFSFLILGLMGQSNEAGAANIAGSLIGGLLHALIRRNRIKELREIYLNKSEVQRRKRDIAEEEIDDYCDK